MRSVNRKVCDMNKALIMIFSAVAGAALTEGLSTVFKDGAQKKNMSLEEYLSSHRMHGNLEYLRASMSSHSTEECHHIRYFYSGAMIHAVTYEAENFKDLPPPLTDEDIGIVLHDALNLDQSWAHEICVATANDDEPAHYEYSLDDLAVISTYLNGFDNFCDMKLLPCSRDDFEPELARIERVENYINDVNMIVDHQNAVISSKLIDELSTGVVSCVEASYWSGALVLHNHLREMHIPQGMDNVDVARVTSMIDATVINGLELCDETYDLKNTDFESNIQMAHNTYDEFRVDYAYRVLQPSARVVKPDRKYRI